MMAASKGGLRLRPAMCQSSISLGSRRCSTSNSQMLSGRSSSECSGAVACGPSTTTMPMPIATATELHERRLPCEAHIRLGCEELEASHAFCGFLRSRALLLREFRRAHYMLNHGSLHAVQSFEARHHEVYDMSHKMVRWPGPLC